ncbi:MAG: DNA-binding protein [Thermoprotei archaeon]|nr:MAG: DNA-binding protein [Thermoprotei archaeon]
MQFHRGEVLTLGEGYGYDEELEMLRRKKLLEYQRRLLEERAKAEAEARKEAMLRVILTPEARSRLTNLKMVYPELAERLELELIRLAQAGKLPTPITDSMLRNILEQISRRRREIRIRRM